MTDEPRYTVVVAAYNASQFIGATLDSVLAQTDPRWECIVVDDGSSDETPAIVERYSARDGRFRLVRQENAGQSAARNRGAGMAAPSSAYFWFLDSDDLLRPEALATAGKYLDGHPQVGIVGCGFEEVDESGRSLGLGHRSRWVPGRVLPRDLQPDEAETPFVVFFCATGMGPFAMHRRAVFERTEGYDVQLRSHEDADIFCQSALIAEVHFIPVLLYVYRKRATSMTQIGQAEWDGGDLFRRKWDHRPPGNPTEAAILRSALRYNYRVHTPLRDVKVALKTIRLLRAKTCVSQLCWAGSLLASAAAGVCGLTLRRSQR